MDFVTAEQFLEQPKEIQKVFIDWWKPKFGDLFTTEKVYDEIDVIVNTYEKLIYGMNDTFKGNIYDYVDETLIPFPILQMHQLVKFTEDKSQSTVNINHFKTNGYDVCLVDRIIGRVTFENLGRDLLQALWRVAIKIAGDEVQNEN